MSLHVGAGLPTSSVLPPRTFPSSRVWRLLGMIRASECANRRGTRRMHKRMDMMRTSNGLEAELEELPTFSLLYDSYILHNYSLFMLTLFIYRILLVFYE